MTGIHVVKGAKLPCGFFKSRELYLRMSNDIQKPTSSNSKSLRFRCRQCSKRYKTKGGLNLHEKSHRPDEFLIECPECDFTTLQKANMAKHVAVKHRKNMDGETLNEDFVCMICNYKCITENQLKSHNLRKHISESEKEFRCTLCEYATVEKAALTKHIRIRHTQQRPYSCQTCSFTVHTASALARHQRSHTQIKPYQCPICPMSYADKKRLKDHSMKHANIKPFSCTSCSYSTNRRDNLNTHIKRNHVAPPSWVGIGSSTTTN